MVDEKTIAEYKNFYKLLLPVIGNRYTITKLLEGFLKQYYPFLQAVSRQEYIREYDLKTLRWDIKSFVKKSFPSAIFKLYENPPEFQQKISASTGSLGSDLALQLLMDRLRKIGQKHPDKKIHEISYEYNFIYKIYDCLKNYGLHNDIVKRDPSVMRYNVIIEHVVDRKNKETDCLKLISLEKLMKCVIEPYHIEKPILINGVRIQAKNNKRTTITTTLLKDDEIDLFRAKNSCRTDVDFARSCKDETNRLLDEMLQVDTEKQEPMRKVPFIGALLNNPNISRVVEDAFFRLVPQPSPDEPNRRNMPFQVQIHGAFPIMIDWEWVDHKVNTGYFSEIGVTKVEIDQYLIKYGQAFVEGYYAFEKEILDKHSSLFNELSDKEQRIFEYATNWFMNRSGFPEAMGGNRHILSVWPEAGRDAGFFYRAWYIILENSKRFEAKFDNKQLPAKDAFLDKFIEGVEKLQEMEARQHFIRLLKGGKKKDEGAFRDWFITFFSGAYEFVEAEPLKGTGRIDLKIQDKVIGKKIIEFKGWWNRDVVQIAEQISKYLTDFDRSGYILLVNHLKKKNIVELYKKIVVSTGTGYVNGTWQEVQHKNSHFTYFTSEHRMGNKSKIIYHIIYRLYP